MSDGATNLSDLLGGGPVQSPAYAPMVTGGGDPFIAPQPSNQPAMSLKSNDANFYMVYRAFKNLLTYFSFFLAAVIISLPAPRHNVCPSQCSVQLNHLVGNALVYPLLIRDE